MKQGSILIGVALFFGTILACGPSADTARSDPASPSPSATLTLTPSTISSNSRAHVVVSVASESALLAEHSFGLWRVEPDGSRVQLNLLVPAAGPVEAPEVRDVDPTGRQEDYALAIPGEFELVTPALEKGQYELTLVMREPTGNPPTQASASLTVI